MGYSNSKETIDRVRDILDAVLRANGSRIEFKSKVPVKASYVIRDAIKAAQVTGGEELKYASITDTYKLLTRADRIIFEPRSQVHIDPSPVESLAAEQKLEIPLVSTYLEVIGACIKHKAPLMTFPDYVAPSQLELVKIASWCLRNNYRIVDDKLLTIKKNDPAT